MRKNHGSGRVGNLGVSKSGLGQKPDIVELDRLLKLRLGWSKAADDEYNQLIGPRQSDLPVRASNKIDTIKPMAPELVSGAWRDADEMSDYRSERFTDMLVERATWTEDSSVRKIDDAVVAAPGYIWFRFWLLSRQQIVDRYFSAEREAVGMLAPINGPFWVTEQEVTAADLALALWLQDDGRVTVLNEAEFDAAVAAQSIDHDQAEYAEQRIRELILEIGQNLFPPAMVRNFILKDSEET